MRIKLIPEAKKIYKAWSVQIMFVLTVITLIDQHYSYFSHFIGDKYNNLIVAGFGIASIALRLIRQDSLRDDDY